MELQQRARMRLHNQVAGSVCGIIVTCIFSSFLTTLPCSLLLSFVCFFVFLLPCLFLSLSFPSVLPPPGSRCCCPSFSFSLHFQEKGNEIRQTFPLRLFVSSSIQANKQLDSFVPNNPFLSILRPDHPVSRLFFYYTDFSVTEKRSKPYYSYYSKE